MYITKTFKLLFFLMMGIIALPEQARADSCGQCGVFAPNSQSKLSSSSLCSTLSGSCSSLGLKSPSEVPNSYVLSDYSGYDMNCTYGIGTSSWCTSCASGFALSRGYFDNESLSAAIAVQSSLGMGCCLHLTGYLSGGGGLCNVQSSHACGSGKCSSSQLMSSSASSCSCISCPSNASCDGSTYMTCKTGYYKINDYATSCTVCPANATCTNGESFTCNTGYALSTDGLSCILSSCSSGKYLNGTTCTSCPSYASCTDGFTFSCNSGFTNTGSACVCYSGNYINSSNVCTSCPTYATCSGQNTTTFTCPTGYTKSTSSCTYTGKVSSCPSGSSKSSCLDCCQR